MEDSVQRIHITPINGDRSAVGAIGMPRAAADFFGLEPIFDSMPKEIAHSFLGGNSVPVITSRQEELFTYIQRRKAQVSSKWPTTSTSTGHPISQSLDKCVEGL